MGQFETNGEYAQFRSQQTALRTGRVRRCEGCGGKVGPGRCVLCSVRAAKGSEKKPGGFVDGDPVAVAAAAERREALE